QPLWSSPSSGGADPCRLLKCRTKETCKLEKGVATCVHDYMGTCMGSPALQYHTFDGMTMDIRGGCTYTLAKSCGNDPTLVPFVVEEKKSEGDSKEWLTKVYVCSTNLLLFSKVNNKPINVPTTLEAGKLQISQSKGRPMLQTAFGLQVTYDEDWAIMVAVPSSYFGATCGLCGNFNEDTEDEMALPDGTQAATMEVWAESWRDASCQDDCEGQEMLQDTCGLPGGASPGLGLMCRHHLSQHLQRCPSPCLVHALFEVFFSTLAPTAQRCPQNSHFEACGAGCPATCTRPRGPTSCSEPCTPGCRCNEGFVLHNRTCIPMETCACVHNGRSYKAQEEFWEDGTCQSWCRCDGDQVTCRKRGCKAHEKCAVVNGAPRCQVMKHLTCIGTGDPHYTTFDGLRYDFQGTCIYQFAALCTQRDPKLVPFTVKVENNNRGSKAVWSPRPLPTQSWATTPISSRFHELGPTTNLLQPPPQVNGAFVELPFTKKDQFELYHSGVHGFVRTAFGLRVSFDWYSYARVLLPEVYAGAVCGLCGNANGDPNDDFVTSDGQRATDEVHLANSWKVGDVPGCSSGCEGDCPTCNQEQKERYRGDGYCGVISKAEGPFRACHGVVDPMAFLEDCAFDACHYKGHRDTVCKAIAAYVTECQSHGVNVEPWRTSTFCGPSCPRHSHYELCGTSCPTTCRGLATACDSTPCTEGCFCDQGFVLSGDECVPVAECGCEHRDLYYKKGEVFFSSCREQCHCKAKGVVECQEVFCGAHEECRVEDGLLGCYPTSYGRLVVSGDPHYVTFDGRAFDLAGSCTYVLVQLCKPERWLMDFSVLLEHDVGHRGNVMVSGVGATWLCSYGPFGPRVDGERYTLPLVTKDKKLRVGQEGNNIILQTTAGIRLLYNVATYLLVTIPDAYKGHVCGLGGNYNGDPSDDFRVPGGSLAQSTEDFVTSWKVHVDDGTCTDGCAATACPMCDATAVAPYAGSGSCGIIRDPLGPFGSCHPKVSPLEYFNHCLHDVCAAAGAPEVLCHSVQAYAAACQAASAEVKAWRTSAFCPLSCPPHSHYELCTRTCDFTCSSLSMPAPCTWTCFEGCQCDDGYLFDGDTCVSLEQCGCLHQGRYFKVSSAIEASVEEGCTCHPSQGLVCEDIQCPQDHVCSTRDGAQLCVKQQGQCHLRPGASLTTFDGTKGMLLTSGTYKVAALCNEQSPNWFKVVLEVNECREDHVPAAVAIFLFFREAFITINTNMEVWVRTCPKGAVTLTVGATMVNRLCAPCGNFNGDPKDDLKLPDGRLVRSIAEVVDRGAWMIHSIMDREKKPKSASNQDQQNQIPLFPPPQKHYSHLLVSMECCLWLSQPINPFACGFVLGTWAWEWELSPLRSKRGHGDAPRHPRPEMGFDQGMG
uniref:VWFD domain-containing protein n=1 Tax=Amazona collaria TaxID=241587 RepID=A0A8B9FGJ5_9PSIT